MNEVLPNKTKIRCDQNSVEIELGCIIKSHYIVGIWKKEGKFFFSKIINVWLIKLKFVQHIYVENALILYRAKIQPSKMTRSIPTPK